MSFNDKKRKSLTAFALLLFLLGGCSSNAYLRHDGHASFEKNNYAQAIEAFQADAVERGSNQLLFKLDLGMSFFANRQYNEAIREFLEAEKIAEIKDYTSISEEVGVLVTGEDVRGYKGEDFEKVLINVYLALSFAAIGDLEEALVECRKINLLLRRMIDEGKRNYQESAFARYLSGMLWEASGEWNSAYIDFKKAYEIDPQLPGIASDLILSARKSGLSQAERDWRIQFPSAPLRQTDPKKGELVVFFERGQSPRKYPNYDDKAIPQFRSRFGGSQVAVLIVDGEQYSDFVEFLNVDKTSKDYLQDRLARMRLARMKRTAVKAALASAAGAATDDGDLGWLTFWLLMGADTADLRSWLSLPKAIDMMRIELPAGKHWIQMNVSSSSGRSHTIDFGEVEIRPRKKVFLMGR